MLLSYRIMILALLSCFFYTCVDPLGFEGRKEDDVLVVDGKVNLQDSVQTVYLTRTEVVGRSGSFPAESGADIMLLENDVAVAHYTETAPGVYQVVDFKPQGDKSYHIEIQLRNGDRYASEPAMMPKRVPVDSAYFIFDKGTTLTLFSRIRIPSEGGTAYLRWRVRHVYQRSDLQCGSLDVITTCYYESNRPTDNQTVPLLDGSDLAAGSVVEFAITEDNVAAEIFGEITYYTILQESLPQSAFQYWEKVNTLLSQTGSIFDAPPGQVRGNIFKVGEPEALVLGTFYPASEEVVYVKTIPGDFAPVQLNPYCGAPGFPPVPFPFPECCYCTFGIEKPDYWR